MDDGLKAYLNLVKLELNISNERMKEIAKQVEYLDNEIPKILENYKDGKIDIFSFLIYISYVLVGIVDDRDILEGFTKLLIKMYDAIRKPS
jgi:hypothetical protein